MHSAKINTAIIGFGYSAKTFHIPFVTTLEPFRLTTMVSSQAEQVKTDHPTLAVFSDTDDMLKQADIELVIITAPNSLHYDLAKRCLLAGKHVLVEKPFVTRPEHGRELDALAREKGLVLCPFHNRRRDGDFMTLQQLISDDAVGDVRVLESRFDRFRPNVRQRWREQSGDGAGILFDLGPHLIDQSLCLFGLPQAVTARALSIRENSEACDYFHLILHYDNLEVILNSSPFCAGKLVRFHLQGTQGDYKKYQLDFQEDQLKNGVVPGSQLWKQLTQEPQGELANENGMQLIDTQSGDYAGFFVALANAIRNGDQPPATAQEAINGLNVVLAAIESSETGRTIALN